MIPSLYFHITLSSASDVYQNESSKEFRHSKNVKRIYGSDLLIFASLAFMEWARKRYFPFTILIFFSALLEIVSLFSK